MLYAPGMSDDENPFQSPRVAGSPFGSGLARQVPVVAVLMVIQGVLELLMSMFLLLIGGLIPAMMANMPAEPNQPLAAFGWWIGGFYLAVGAIVVVAGVLKVFAGWRNFQFRNRGLGIAALASGMASTFTCYCAPTGLALFIYGLIVYLNGHSTEAFAMGDQGRTREEILHNLA